MYKNFFKRIIDLFFGILIFIVLLPVFSIIYILVKFRMGSPVFFRQKRTGKNRAIFEIIKFRTMINKTKSEENDSSRLTKLGFFLRKTSLDELPQILNIIKGEMSFIGPRPLLPEYLNYYYDGELSRFDVRPGMSGYAEIIGRHKISWDDQFKYDTYYSANVSLILDLKILLITIPKVLHISNVSSLSRENKRLDIIRSTKNNIQDV